MRPWLSGIMSPCQGLVGVSITPGRTTIPRKGDFAWPGSKQTALLACNRNRRSDVSACPKAKTSEA